MNRWPEPLILPGNTGALVTFSSATGGRQRVLDDLSIVNSLTKLAEDNKVKKALVDKILEQQAETRNFSTGKHLKYVDLIEHMVSVEQVIRIERQNDTHTIANKTFDFSRVTIRQLMREGYEETLEQETNILQVWDSEHPR